MTHPTHSFYLSRPLPTTPDHGCVANSSRMPTRREPPPIPPYPQGGGSSGCTDWPQHVVDDPVRRELEEARARTVQMEKTMRWWSDCTANWREKWSKMRDDRNHARDECRRLRAELDATTLKHTLLAKHRDQLSAHTQDLENQLQSLGTSQRNIDSVKPCSNVTVDELAVLDQSHCLDSPSMKSTSLCSRLTLSDAGDISCHGNESRSKHSEHDCTASPSAELLQQLDEARELISVEKREKVLLLHTVDELKAEVIALMLHRNELEKSEKDARLQVDELQQWKQDRMEQMASNSEDDAGSGNAMEQRLAELRRELEKLQAENAQEWALREKLGCEKVALERENKRMHGEITRLQEELSDMTQQAMTLHNLDLKSLQEAVSSKTKELSDLRHTHSRMKKTLQEQTAELEHARGRLEHYEDEVKKLRTRIEELKCDLGNAEDECDQQANQARRMQRTNEELQQQVDSLTIQLLHLQTRLYHTKPSSDASVENSSEDLTAHDLSDLDAADHDKNDSAKHD